MKSTFDRSYADDVLPEKLEKYMNELEADVLLNEMNVREKAQLKASIAAKWARFSYEEEYYKKKIEEAIAKYKVKVAEALFEKKKIAVANQAASAQLIDLEVKKYIKTDEKYLKLSKELDTQNDVLRFINEAKQIISGFGFDIKNALEVLKLETI